METRVDSVVDCDNINTSTPWKLRFVKSPVVSPPICKQVDSDFELFVSGLREKVSTAEDSLKEAGEKKIAGDSIREKEGLHCDDIDNEKTMLPPNTDKASTSTNNSSIVCSQTADTLPSAKLWKPVATSYDSFIVLDETIMTDESNEEDSFKKYDENFAKNISGILPLNETAKLMNSPKFGGTRFGNVTDLIILDETNYGKNLGNEIKSRSILSEEDVCQNTQNQTSVKTGHYHNESNTIEVENNVNNQKKISHGVEDDDKPFSAPNTLLANELEPNATLGQLQRIIGKNEQVMYTDEEDDKLEQVKSGNEETAKNEQVMSDNLQTEKVRNIEQVQLDSRGTGNTEQVKLDNLESGVITQVKSESGETEKLKSDNRETEQVKSDIGETLKTEQVMSENLETLETAQVKPENEETEKVKTDDDQSRKIERLKPDNRETGNIEKVKSDNLKAGKIEQVKSESGETEKLKSASEVTVRIEQMMTENMETAKVKSESGETEKLKSVSGVTVKIERVMSENMDTVETEQVMSENMETVESEQVKFESEETAKVKSGDQGTIKVEQVESDSKGTRNIEQVKSDNLEAGKIEQVKADSGDFVSSDPEENADNNNPEWELLKKLETDEERYKAVRLRWRNLVIPNPNKNLTYRSRGCWTTDKKQKQVPEVKHNPVVTSRKRTHSADPTEHHVPAKRQRTFSCTEVFDRKMIDIHKNLSRERNAILQQHERAVQSLVDKTNHQLRSYQPGSVNDERIRALHVQNVVELRYKCDNRLAAVESESMNQLRTLEKAMEEVRVFNTFYQGLEEGCEDALLLTDEQLMEVLEEDHLYECFTEFYNG